MMGIDQRVQISDHEFLSGRQIVAQEILDHAVHDPGMKDVADQRHQQKQERKKGQNRVGGDRESEGVDFGPEQIARC